jgi:hypothetical protein
LPSQSEEEDVTPVEGEDATPDALAEQLHFLLAPEAEQYGLEIDRIEVQHVQLPGGIQEAIDRVWKATLLPAQTSQEARARYNQIKAELEAVKHVLGVKNAAIDHILKNVRAMKCYGGLPEPLEQLLASLFRRVQQEPPKLPAVQSPPHLSDGSAPAGGSSLKE